MKILRRSILSLALLCSFAAGEDAVGKLSKPELIGKLPEDVNESSGLIKSRRHADKGVFWTHNDSGDSSRIFAVDLKGKLLRTVNVPHAANVDWEELTMDDQGRLIACDIGDNKRDDNGGRRKGVVLYRFAEPDAFDKNEKPAKPDVFHFHYPAGEGPCDAEGAFARDGSVFLFTKKIEGTVLYKLPLPESAPTESVVMTRVTETKTFNVVTGAALSNDGLHLALINYLTVVVIDLPAPFEKMKPDALFSAPRRAVTALLGQTEAVAWDGERLILTTEGGDIFTSK